MTDDTVERRLRTVIGTGLRIEHSPSGTLIVSPSDERVLALILETASAERWPVCVRGAATWSGGQPDAALLIDTSGLADVTYFDPGDMVVSAQAGMSWSALKARLADHGAWLPLDPPGEGRTIGSIVSTATSGPLRCGFGGVRDHLLGATLITGDGKVVKPGGKVVKNVAGFDLVKLATGSFGAFGVITSVTFRLRAVPRSDLTLVAQGNRDQLLRAASRLLRRGVSPAALELYAEDPDQEWTLAIRLIGTDAGVRAERDAVAGATDGALSAAADGGDHWRDHAAQCLDHPTTLRVGVPPGTISTALDLIRHDLDPGWTSVSVFPGAVRWSGTSSADRIKLFRYHAAQHELPVTVERAPVSQLTALGHFGAYREGVGRLVTSLRRAFDPNGIFLVPERAV